MRDRKRERERGAKAKGQAGSPRRRDPDAGLEPRTRDHDLSQRQMLKD